MQHDAIDSDIRASHRVRRIAYRASYDPETIYQILDAAYICNIAFVYDGLPSVIPMTFWRDESFLYFHSGTGGRFETAMRSSPICISVTIFDGLVLGHSPINHSVNYRSVVAHGQAEAIDDQRAKIDAMEDFFAKTIPGRWQSLRAVREEEINALTVFRLKLDQAAAKIRNEYADREDHMPEGPLWTGLLPAHLVFEPPISDPRFASTAMPAYLAGFEGKGAFKDRIDRAKPVDE